MNTQEVLTNACRYLKNLVGHEFDVIEVSKPVSPDAAVNLAKIISKLSPLVGNLIEFNVCEYLNDQPGFANLGQWERQDPGFPDTVFKGTVSPTPGIEVKAWFPLATEITARFKDSSDHFKQDETYVAILAWLPEFLIFGKPHIIDIVTVSAASVAKSRDDHYHQPPGYLVLEPGDTAARTINLRQTTTAGYTFQGTPAQLADAAKVVAEWGETGSAYSAEPAYQELLRTLIVAYEYRLDTNFAKIDRIGQPAIEAFKSRVYRSEFHGRTISDWNQLLSRGSDERRREYLAQSFDITDDGSSLVE